MRLLPTNATGDESVLLENRRTEAHYEPLDVIFNYSLAFHERRVPFCTIHKRELTKAKHRHLVLMLWVTDASLYLCVTCYLLQVTASQSTQTTYEASEALTHVLRTRPDGHRICPPIQPSGPAARPLPISPPPQPPAHVEDIVFTTKAPCNRSFRATSNIGGGGNF